VAGPWHLATTAAAVKLDDGDEVKNAELDCAPEQRNAVSRFLHEGFGSKKRIE
jgi:hypothetical protein